MRCLWCGKRIDKLKRRSTLFCKDYCRHISWYNDCKVFARSDEDLQRIQRYSAGKLVISRIPPKDTNPDTKS